MRSRIVAVIAAAVVAVMGFTAPAHAAQATVTTVSEAGVVHVVKMTRAQAKVFICDPGYICLYDYDPSLNSPILYAFAGSIVRNTCNPLSNGNTSYIVNATTVRWYVYTNTGCSLNQGTIHPNSEGAMASPWNNNIHGIVRTSATT